MVFMRSDQQSFIDNNVKHPSNVINATMQVDFKKS